MTLKSMVVIHLVADWLSHSHRRLPKEGVEGRSQGTMSREVSRPLVVMNRMALGIEKPQSLLLGTVEGKRTKFFVCLHRSCNVES
jgi:hypothetical protein